MLINTTGVEKVVIKRPQKLAGNGHNAKYLTPVVIFPHGGMDIVEERLQKNQFLQ
jgi:hypothetical protein